MWLISLKKSIPTFDLVLKSSKQLKAIVVVTVIVAVTSIGLSDIHLYLKGALSIFLLVYAPFLYQKINSYQALKKISCLSDGCWSLQGMDGDSTIYALNESSTVLGPFFFMHFKNTVDTLNVVLVSDSISKDDARRLRLTLNVYSNELMKAKV